MILPISLMVSTTPTKMSMRPMTKAPIRPTQPTPGLVKALTTLAYGHELAKVADAQRPDAKVLGQHHRHDGQGQGRVHVGGRRPEHGGQGM